MEFQKIIINPPYKKGGKILSKLKKENPNAEFSILMPIYQYKVDDLYKYIKSYIKIGGDGFDACVQENNAIITLGPDNGKQWLDFLLETVEDTMKPYYSYNAKNSKDITLKRCDGIKPEELNPDLDFIESARCVAARAGNGFGKGGCGYKWNVDKSGYLDNWSSMLCKIHFPKKEWKDNFQKWWYFKPKGKGLASKALLGLHLQTVGAESTWAIPQIDWEDIENNTYWINGDYDAAVLDSMGLLKESENVFN